MVIHGLHRWGFPNDAHNLPPSNCVSSKCRLGTETWLGKLSLLEKRPTAFVGTQNDFHKTATDRHRRLLWASQPTEAEVGTPDRLCRAMGRSFCYAQLGRTGALPRQSSQTR